MARHSTLLACALLTTLSGSALALLCGGNLLDTQLVGDRFTVLEVTGVDLYLIADTAQPAPLPAGKPGLSLFQLPGPPGPNYTVSEAVEFRYISGTADDAGALRITPGPNYTTIAPCLMLGVPSSLRRVVVNGGSVVTLGALTFDETFTVDVHYGLVQATDSGYSLNGPALELNVLGYGDILLGALSAPSSAFSHVAARISGTGDIMYSGTSLETAAAVVDGMGSAYFSGIVAGSLNVSQSGVSRGVYVRGAGANATTVTGVVTDAQVYYADATCEAGEITVDYLPSGGHSAPYLRSMCTECADECQFEALRSAGCSAPDVLPGGPPAACSA